MLEDPPGLRGVATRVETHPIGQSAEWSPWRLSPGCLGLLAATHAAAKDFLTAERTTATGNRGPAGGPVRPTRPIERRAPQR